jgi:serine/threonine protein kinase
MKRTCIRCERSSPANSLFCHDVDCPAERSPAILEAGDRVGDIEVLKSITSLRSATLYQALHQGQPVLMKVANPGPKHRDRLIREANFLRSLGTDKKNKKNSFPTLPRLRPPYTTTTLEQDAVGTTMLGRELLHYCLFDPVEGQALEDLLRHQPQWWVNHVGWLSIELATTINTLHLNGLYHFALTPASVLVRFDAKPSVPHIVLCDLGIASDGENIARDWYPDVVPIAYLAPELLSQGAETSRAGVQTDVYSLGLVLYEMLVGQPVFASPLASDAQVVDAVRRDERIRMSRVEDVSPVAEIALHAAATDVEQRPATAADVAEELTGVFGEVPVKKSRPAPSLNLVFVLGGTALIVAFLVTLAVALGAAQP